MGGSNNGPNSYYNRLLVLAKAELDNLPRAPLILICDQSTIDCVRVEKDRIQDIIDHSGISRLTLQRISQQSQVGDTILPKPKWMGTASALVFSSLVFRSIGLDEKRGTNAVCQMAFKSPRRAS